MPFDVQTAFTAAFDAAKEKLQADVNAAIAADVAAALAAQPSANCADELAIIAERDQTIIQRVAELAQRDIQLTAKDAEIVTLKASLAACEGTANPPPIPAGTIPLAFDDPRFAGNAKRTGQLNLAKGATIANTNFTGPAQTASILFLGSGTVKNVAIKSNECIRIIGGNSNVEGCYLEAKGEGEAHADVIQAYSPGANGVHNLKNSMLYLLSGAANCGLFIADKWSGDVNIEDVVFKGGLFGCRIHADDGCTVNVSMKNAYFVGPFTYGELLIEEAGGTLNITKWENVRHATIVNGVLVPGNLIPKP